MNAQNLAAYLKTRCPQRLPISTQEIMAELRLQFPDASDNTHAWRISQLKKENLIQQVGRGQYSFYFKPEYNPDISLKTKRTINRIKPFCKSNPIVWDTAMLDNISTPAERFSWIFLEVSRPELDEIFKNALQFSKKLFANPDKETVSNYILRADDVIILLPQVSETPIINQGEFTTLSIEALLVNAFWHYEKYFKPIDYSVEVLFRNALKQYNVNTSKLLRFAARRDKRGEIEQLLKKIAK